MAMAKRCDRCNAYFQISKNKPNVVAIAYADYRGSIDGTSQYGGWQDLCSECMDAFSVWMKGAMKEDSSSEG